MLIDPLERRQLFAAIGVGRTLTGEMYINGDAEPNSIRIAYLSRTHWRIEHAGTINGLEPKSGETMAVFDSRRPWTRLLIETGGGADKIELIGLGSTVRLNIDAGADNDYINISRYSPPTGTIVGGSGSDTISLTRTSGVPTFNIDGGSGNDLIGLRDVSTRRMSILGNAGSDNVLIANSRTRGGFEYAGGSGIDRLTIRTSELHTPRIVDDAGEAFMTLDGCRLFGSSYFEGSGERDRFSIANSRNFGDMRVSLGDGDDRYSEHNLIQASITSTIKIDLGDGNNVTDHSMP